VEILVDFGLFELIAALGLAAAARAIYSHRALRIAFLVSSVGAPAILVFVVHGELARWLATAALVTALVNGTVLVIALRRGELDRLLRPRPERSV
jgi:hypothetical protein